MTFSDYGIEQESKASEFQAKSILESISDAFFALDRSWRFTYLNSHAERLLQRPKEQLLGTNLWTEFPQTVGTDFDRQYHRAADEKVTVAFEEYYPSPIDKWFEVKAYSSRDGLSVYFNDVTDRINAQKALLATQQILQASESQLRNAQVRLEAALTAAGVAAFDWDLLTDRIKGDSNLAKLFSLPPDDASTSSSSANFFQVIHPDDREHVHAAIDSALSHGDLYEVDYRIVSPNGGQRWLSARGRVERDPEGRAVAIPGVVADITERTERSRREGLLQHVAESARDLTDEDAVIANALSSLCEYLGISRCAYADIDLDADSCIIRFDHPSADDLFRVVRISSFGSFLTSEFRNGRPVVVDDVQNDSLRVPSASLAAYEAMNIRAHLSVPMIHSSRAVSCLTCHSATPRHWTTDEVELVRGVLERTWLPVEVIRQQKALAKEAEERREAHERTVAILENITGAFYALNSDYRFTYVNRRAEALWGIGREDLLGHSITDAFPQILGTLALAHHQQVMGGRLPSHFETLSAVLGRWVEVSIFPTADGGLSVFFHDISGRKALENERQRLAEDNRLLLDSTGDGIYGIDVEGRFTFFNRAAERMLGFERDQLLGKTAHALIHHSRQDGTLYPDHECPIYQTLRTGQSSRIEDDVFWRIDRTPFPISYSAAPVLEGGAVCGVVITFSDISERKALEKEREGLALRERRLLREVLANVTGGRLLLCDTPADLPQPLLSFGKPVVLTRDGGLKELRRLTLDAAKDMPDEGRHDLVTAVSEAEMNAIVHGGGGIGKVAVGADGTVQVWVEDKGTGIATENLPRATLSRGFSTKETLGHGLKMMLQTVDRIYLLTGPTGTTVVLEQERERPLPAWL